MKKAALVLLLLSLCPIRSLARNYYIDACAGNDEASGHSPSTAWRTLERASGLCLAAGDSLLLKRGDTFHGTLRATGRGKAKSRAVIAAYGTGAKPCIVAPDSSLWAVLVEGADYLTVQDLDITNTGSEPMPHRTGIKVAAEDCGTSHDIVLRALDVHDVNGSLVKSKGGGSGILIVNGGREKVSLYDGLLIEECTVRRCGRNGMIWAGYHNRAGWHPNLNVVVRRNLLEGIPGDGIVPIGCDGALVEYNLMRDCPGTLPTSEAAAGFWPWSCDNTVLQYNEVSQHRAPWDGQAYDSDYNCNNTTIRYNYSHDNDGGLVLICNHGADRGVGNNGTVVEYNLSIGDGQRPRATRDGIFSPAIHIGGPCQNTLVHRNILHACPKPEPFIDRCMVTSDSWVGYANDTRFVENVFYAPEPSAFRMTESTANRFEGNAYIGTFASKPADTGGINADTYLQTIAVDPSGRRSLDFLLDHVVVGDGAAVLRTVNAERMQQFFDTLTKKP